MISGEARDPRSVRLIADVLWIGVVVAVAATPLIIDTRGRDVFRLPKTAFFEAAVTVLFGGAIATALVLPAFARRFMEARRCLILAGATVGWVAVVSMTALVPETARSAPFTMFCHAVLFILTVGLAREHGFPGVAIAVFVPASLNATLLLLQALGIWQPFEIVRASTRLGSIGLIGNPNMAGTYLLLPTIAALATTLASARYRTAAGALAVLLLAALFAAQTVSVLIAFGAALVALAISGTRNIRIAVSFLVAAGLAAVLLHAPTRQRLTQMAVSASRGEFATVTSGRVPAWTAAVHMFTDHPLLGVGPGGFAARYMPYRLRVEETHPDWFRETRENFGEAHNDHAQVLAEGGLAAYALFLGFLVSIARLGFRRETPNGTSARFVRAFALPAVVGFAVVALGQFPLELTAVTSTSAFLAGVCFAWSDHARD